MSVDVKDLLSVAEKQCEAWERNGKPPEINVPVWREMFKAARERIQQLDVPVESKDRCYYCGMPMRSLQHDGLILNDGYDEMPNWYLEHYYCGRNNERGYVIQLGRIVKRGSRSNPYADGGDSLYGWIDHLQGKNWFWRPHEEALKLAHREAVRLARVGT